MITIIIIKLCVSFLQLADVLQHQDRIIELQALNMKLEFVSI